MRPRPAKRNGCATAFSARGTLRKDGRGDDGHALRLWAELGAIYFGLPLLVGVAVSDYGVPLFYALPPVLLGFTAVLLLDGSYSLRNELKERPNRAALVAILLTFIVGSVVLAGVVTVVVPERLFDLPARQPMLWLTIMAIYPFASVLPQEIAYRVFFFHRYGALFTSRWDLIIANALVFAFGHVIFQNWIAIAGSFSIGLLFAWRYERTRAFWAVFIEHVLWGWLVFTIGLGSYFLTGLNDTVW